MVEMYKEQLEERDEQSLLTRRDYDGLQADMARIQAENDSAKDEVKEVLQALEELAMNYDQKSQEADSRGKENEVLSDDLQKKRVG